ncbi:transcriptional regulator [Marinomonas sp. A79]|uniref:Transcriptional regulator n=1 Tax=Marinomonas vulgaris TaxID=2823372 RepID=A0ABS5HC22_9GAMM|nr:TyrR/PhhR family helix-turn-helix DNA-binding protein [Marinomonas vulgaris]MBR7889213.1 transcriptional regulator [Marinomonas vulgaris]
MRLEIQCEDRIGMVREALDLFIPHGIDMRLVEVDTQRRCIYCGFSDIPFPKLQRLLADIRRLDSVEDVKTVMFTPSEREHNALYTLLEALPDGVVSVDLKGQITMVTQLAADDLGVVITDLLHKPLSLFIKGLNVSKDTWTDPNRGMSKRIRLRGKTLLLETKPIFVTHDDGAKLPAGSVIYLKSQARLDRQTASLKQAPEAENHLEHYFQPSVIKSGAMGRTLLKARAFAHLDAPLLIQGEVGTGKRDLIEALFQYWQQQQGDDETQLRVRSARDLSQADIAQLDNPELTAGWLVIEDIEHLDKQVQLDLVQWLLKQPSMHTSLDAKVRIVSVSSKDEKALGNGEILDRGLYFELASLVLSLPSLRERKADLEGLVQQTLLSQSERYRFSMPSVSKGALAKLALYDWPGNLKELQNVCLQTLLTATNKEWQAEDIHLAEAQETASLRLLDGSLEKTVKQWEADLLRRLYPNFPSTRKLANAVGMSHSAIANKLKEYGINTKTPD